MSSKIPYLTLYNEDGSIAELGELWSPITGCSGKGCKAHCWARDMVRRFPAIHGWEPIDIFKNGYIQKSKKTFDAISFSHVQFHPDRLDKPLHWRKPRRIGVSFTGDLFDEQVRGSWLYSIYPVMVEADWHTYFVLTKQVKRMAQWISNTKTAWKNRTSHIYHGVSICDQEDADTKIPELLRIPGKHWVSIEPMLGAVDVSKYGPILNYRYDDPLTNQSYIRDYPMECAGEYPIRMYNDPCIDWLVLGCESGKKRRPCQLEWMGDVVEQCQVALVPVYCKQIQNEKGRVIHDINLFPEALKVRQLP